VLELGLRRLSERRSPGVMSRRTTPRSRLPDHRPRTCRRFLTPMIGKTGRAGAAFVRREFEAYAGR
jgi:hypothetical protein